METIAGEWIMKGCRRTDPECLHSPDDLLALVRQVGFLPLFSGDIPGFSVKGRLHLPGMVPGLRQLPPGRLRLGRHV